MATEQLALFDEQVVSTKTPAEPFRSIYVHFTDRDGIKKLSERIGVDLSTQTRYISLPDALLGIRQPEIDILSLIEEAKSFNDNADETVDANSLVRRLGVALAYTYAALYAEDTSS